MQFREFLITEADEQLSRWKEYVNDTPMLAAAVKILNRIESKGYQAYIVGGCVRDLVLGEKMHDVDIATNCPINILENMFRVYDIGKSKDFGIITTKMNGFDFEIAQFRQDSYMRIKGVRKIL